MDEEGEVKSYDIEETAEDMKRAVVVLRHLCSAFDMLAARPKSTLSLEAVADLLNPGTAPSKPQEKAAPSTTAFTRLSEEDAPEWARQCLDALREGLAANVQTP